MLELTPYQIENPDKVLFALAIQEKNRRDDIHALNPYIPHAKQVPFHKSLKKIRAIFGANRSGKSIAGAAESAWWATGLHPHRDITVPNHGRICTVDFEKYLKGVIIPLVKSFIPREYLTGCSWEESYNRESRILTLVNGSTIEFMSYDQDVEKYGGAKRDWIWEDEECPSDKHRENMMRLIDTGGSMWITETPLKGMTWVFHDIFEQPPNHPVIDSFVFDITDNPHLNQDDVEAILSTFPPDEIDARKHGQFISVHGKVYPNFKRENNVVPFYPIERSWRRICGIDPHPRKATGVVWLAVNHYDEYIVYDELKDSSLINIALTAQRIKDKEGDMPVDYRVIDSSARTNDPVHGVFIQREFERCGIRTGLATKDLDPGINLVRELLEPREVSYSVEKKLKAKLFVMDNCVQLIRELEHYVWDEYRGPNPDYVDVKRTPLKKNDDLVDCLRYICMTRPRYEKIKPYYPKRATIDPYTGY